ncbi:MAG: LuxR C-terminal-related transcriptional regulator [Oculatellaceae cyanobacterium Prado106]|nr:LuxR C-terminal-related transcriptional regulator [Oculatellaceae cyanobacterium Prado106]
MSKIPDEFLSAIATQHSVSEAELQALTLALQGQTAEQIAAALTISSAAVRKRLGSVYLKFRIDGKVRGQLEKLKESLLKQYGQGAATVSEPQADWEESPDVTAFQGRSLQLQQLQQLVFDNHYRCLWISGVGGVGKSALVKKFSVDHQRQFEFVIWRSLRSPRPLRDLIASILPFLSSKADKRDLPSKDAPTQQWISSLIDRLKVHQCLLVLDNLETVFGSMSEVSIEEHEEYALFFRQILEVRHQSCLLVTSRYKPIDEAWLGTNVADLIELSGLTSREVKQILADPVASPPRPSLEESHLFGTDEDWEKLTKAFSGNALTLKIATSIIRDEFNGNIARFLESDTEGIGVSQIFDRQFKSLSPFERDLLYWLAINRTPVTPVQLQADQLTKLPVGEILKTLHSLRRQSLVERNPPDRSQPNDNQWDCFYLSEVVLSYTTDKMVEKLYEDLTQGNLMEGLPLNKLSLETEDAIEETHPKVLEPSRPGIFGSHAFAKAQSPEHIRDAQIAAITRPLANRLQSDFYGNREGLRSLLEHLLEQIRKEPLLKQSYAASNLIHLCFELDFDLKNFNFSTFAIRQGYFRRTKLHDVDFSDCHLENCLFSETFGGILSVRFHPLEPSILASSDTNGTIYLWQIAEGKQIFKLEGHTSWVETISFHPDGKFLASASEDNTVRIWDTRTGYTVSDPPLKHGGRVWCVSYSPDGNTLASGCDNGQIYLWDVRGMAQGVQPKWLRSLSTPPHSPVWSVSYSHDGKWLASAGDSNQVMLWNLQTGKNRAIAGQGKRILLARFHPHQPIVAIIEDHAKDHAKDYAGVQDQEEPKTLIRLYDVEKRRDTQILEGHAGEVWLAAFSPDGRWLATAGENAKNLTIHLWDANTGQSLAPAIEDRKSRIWSITFSPDSKTLVSGSSDQTIRLWDIQEDEEQKIQLLERKKLQGYDRCVRSLAFSPDGTTLISGGSDRTLHLWNVTTQNSIADLDERHGWIWSVAYSPNGQTFASGHDDSRIILWDAIDHQRRFPPLRGHTQTVYSVAFSPDNKLLASGSKDGTVKLWVVRTGQHLLTTSDIHWNGVRSVCFSPDGSLLASGGSDQVIKLWNPQTGKLLKTLTGHQNIIQSVLFNANGILASLSDTGNIRLWQPETGSQIDDLRCPPGWLPAAIAFSPDGNAVAIGGKQGRVGLWYPPSLNPTVSPSQSLEELEKQDGEVHAIAYHPDGQHLASAGQNGEIHLWNLPSQTYQTLISPRLYEKLNIKGARGLSELQRETLEGLGAIS